MTTPAIETITVTHDTPASTATEIFRTEGVVVLRQAIPADVLAPATNFLRTALADVAAVFSRYGLTVDAPDANRGVHDLLHSGPATVSPEDRHVLLGHYPLSVRLAPILHTIPCFMNEQHHLETLLGSDHLFAHMPPTARYVLPGNLEAAVPAHQDVSYNKHISGFCVMWVPLSEIDAACGGMVVYPRTHTAGELFDGPSVAATNGWLPGLSVKGFEPLVLQPLSPGDVVIMSDRTVHASAPNTSNRTRLSIDFRVFGAHARSSKHYLDLQTGRVIAPQPGLSG